MSLTMKTLRGNKERMLMLLGCFKAVGICSQSADICSFIIFRPFLPALTVLQSVI